MEEETLDKSEISRLKRRLNYFQKRSGLTHKLPRKPKVFFNSVRRHRVDKPLTELYLNTVFNHHSAIACNLQASFSDSIFESRSRKQPFIYDYPYPISKEVVPLTQDWVDIGTHIVDQQQEFERMVERKKINAASKKTQKFWKELLEERDEAGAKMNVFSKVIEGYMEAVESNPDPYFSGKYNWYLCGGNVASLETESKTYIVKSFGATHQLLDIVPINNRRTKLLASKGERYETDDQEPIFEIRTKQDTSSGFNLLVRKRNKVFLSRLEDGQCESFVQYPSKAAFVSADLWDDRFATLNAKKQLKIYDLNVGKAVMKQDFEYVKSLYNQNNWGCVRELSEYGFICADRRTVRICDPRTNVLSSNFALNQYGQLCEELSCLEPSRMFRNLVYVALNHRLLALDLRNFKGELMKSNVVLSWNHLMQLPPQIIVPIRTETSELVVLSSNLIGDCVSVTTERSKKVYTNRTFPYSVPDLIQTFEAVQNAGHCLGPTQPIQKRMRVCITGMTGLDDGTLVCQNSACDVFSNRLVAERSTPDALGNWFESWNARLERHIPLKRLAATGVINKVDLRSVLLDTANDDPVEFFPWRPSYLPWKIPIEQLAQFKDVLAEDLLRDWDLPMEGREDLFKAPTQDMSSTDKVEQWMSQFEGPPQDEEVLMSMELNQTLEEPSSNNNLVEPSFTQSGWKAQEPDVSQFMSVSFDKKETPKPKKRPEKRRHNMGF